MQKLSPKQFIQTKARSLPLYKCYINRDWQEARLANTLVMRRHANGNITAGFYLVDLLCLGVKDTLFFFNETEEEIEERLGDNFSEMFVRAEYELVHNIIYAGHDFAMEFDIKPHADFAVTKFILEEDNDDIPLVEVEVGEEGVPHLYVFQAGQYSDALAKLKKNAGEGNYMYTIGSPFDDEKDDDMSGEFDDDETGEDTEDEDTYADDEGAVYNLEEFDPGEITPLQARYIHSEEIFDEDKVNSRMPNEIMTLQTEACLRILKQANPDLFENDGREGDISGLEKFASGVTEQQENEFKDVQQQWLALYESFPGKTENTLAKEKTALSTSLLASRAGNPLVVLNIFETAIFNDDKELAKTAGDQLRVLTPHYPCAELTRALAALLSGQGDDAYGHIYNSNNIAEAFPVVSDIGEIDINIYALIKTLFHTREGDLQLAVYYYYLSVEMDIFNWLMAFVQVELSDAVTKEIESLLPGDDNHGLRVV